MTQYHPKLDKFDSTGLLLTVLNPKRYLGKRVPCADAGLLLEYAGEYPIHSLSTYVPARSPIAL